MRKPIKGETLWDLPIGNRARKDGGGLRPVTVTSVGGTKYRVDTWSEVTDTCTNHKLYETEQERLEEKEREDACELIYKAVAWERRKALSLTTLRAMHAALLANDRLS